MIPSPTVQGQIGYPVLEFGHEELDAVGRHPFIPEISEPPPPPPMANVQCMIE